MINPFDRATEISIEHPKKVLAIGFVSTLLLSSMAMFLEFDNSEDAFFPDNETVQLLDEVEGEYQASIDFVRIIVRTESDLSDSSTWSHLGRMEAILLEEENLSGVAYPLFGGQANNGPASSAISWLKYQSPENNAAWINGLLASVDALASAEEENYSAAKEALEASISGIPAPVAVTSLEMSSWDYSEPSDWLPKILAGEDIQEELGAVIGASQSLVSDNESKSAELGVLRGQIAGGIAPLLGYQSVELGSSISGTVPSGTADLLASDGPFLVTMTVSTDPEDHGGKSVEEVQADIVLWTENVEREVLALDDESSSVFSFSQFLQGQNANLGAELAILNSASLLILGSILYFTFRSFRDTAFVLGLTVFGILATYGTSGLLTKIGVDMTFNAAMNSIPCLLYTSPSPRDS